CSNFSSFILPPSSFSSEMNRYLLIHFCALGKLTDCGVHGASIRRLLWRLHHTHHRNLPLFRVRSDHQISVRPVQQRRTTQTNNPPPICPFYPKNALKMPMCTEKHDRTPMAFKNPTQFFAVVQSNHRLIAPPHCTAQRMVTENRQRLAGRLIRRGFEHF